MASANQELFDALVRHQIGLLQLAGSIRNGVNEILDDAEDDIEAAIRKRLANMGDGTRSAQELKRMQVLLDIVHRIRLKSWDELNTEWLESMYDVAKAESDSFVKTLKTTSPATLDVLLPTVSKLKAIVNNDMFEGRTFKGWMDQLKQADLVRITSAIQQGMIQGEGVDQIVSRVLGNGGATEMTRNQADSITRTAINNIANETRTQIAIDNADILAGEIFVATLDSRTTPVCRANDGKVFEVGKGPKPPLHFRCRSLRVPTFDGTALGNRPAKASTERGLLREFAEKNKMDPVTSRDDLPFGLKGKYDDFAAKRIRELTGQVSSDTTYQTWLETQSKDFQKDVLGATRARLFRDGKLKLDRFVNRNGDEITLHELAKREADAFRAAGLDPEEF